MRMHLSRQSVDQELGDPEIADFAQAEGIITKSAEDEEG